MRKPSPEKKARLEQDRMTLHMSFPQAFARPGSKWKRPLMVGIHKVVIAAGVISPETGEPLSNGRIRDAIEDYCAGPKYKRAVLECHHRVGPAGEPVVAVSEEDREHARVWLQKFEARRRRWLRLREQQNSRRGPRVQENAQSLLTV
jgi:sRNA-binding protein